MTVKLSRTKEDYIRTVYLLCQNPDRTTRVKNISQYLSLSKSTVSERLRELKKNGLILFPRYSQIRLTSEGYAIAKKLTERHRIIEVFLHEVLKLSKTSVHEEADKLEHGFSDSVIKKLSKFLKKPVLDPHGKKI